jgi:hypothetical protein
MIVFRLALRIYDWQGVGVRTDIQSGLIIVQNIIDAQSPTVVPSPRSCNSIKECFPRLYEIHTHLVSLFSTESSPIRNYVKI